MSVSTEISGSATATPRPAGRRSTQRDHKHVSIALPGDYMFQRLMIGRIARQKELLITATSGKEFIGFIIGWDSEWLQLTTTAEQKLVVIQIMNIMSVEETGNALWNIELDTEKREKIERFTQVIYEKARDAQTEIYRDRNAKSATPTDRVAGGPRSD
jgi:hypothetical protein